MKRILIKRVSMTALGALLAMSAAGCTGGYRTEPQQQLLRGYAPATPFYDPASAQQSGCEERQEAKKGKHAAHKKVTPQNLSAGPHTRDHGEMGRDDKNEGGGDSCIFDGMTSVDQGQ